MVTWQNVVSLTSKISIDRTMCAPGHGKDVVDGINSWGKLFWIK